jgi:pSer/pThr/pTyr-binding forkhead associated (FHA) protein
MDKTAQLVIQTGPDQGQVFPLQSELVRLGTADGNDIVLADTTLAEHHASIVYREGRFAIVTTHAGGLQIDETPVPPERWIWLPQQASIRLSSQTLLQFMVTAGLPQTALSQAASPTAPSGAVPAGTAVTVEAPVSVRPPPRTGTPKPRRVPAAVSPGTETIDESTESPAKPRKSTEKKGRQTARFITDGPGEALVRLGEDGQLPELSLAESGAEGKTSSRPRESNPYLLVGVVFLSLLMTGAMLFMEGEDSYLPPQNQAAARLELAEYLGTETERPGAYQLALRRSRQAWARGDRSGERAELRLVLQMLRSEAKERLQKFSGLTGRLDYDYDDSSKRSDRRLEELIAILLSDA